MKPEFYVFRLGRGADPNAPLIGARPQLQQPRARDNRGIARGFADGEQLVAALEPANANPQRNVFVPNVEGFGEAIARADQKDAVIRFSNQEIAENYAQHLAALNPKVPYCVVGVLSVFETVEAPVIEKKFNAQGELVVSEPEVKL